MVTHIRKAVQNKKRSRREIIAMIFAADIETFSAYQPGRTKIPIYTEGRAYYIALRAGEKVPEGFGQWNKAGDGAGYTIFVAGGDIEAES